MVSSCKTIIRSLQRCKPSLWQAGRHHRLCHHTLRLIRRTPEGGYKEIALNFSAMQKGKTADLLLEPDDVLYIPFSYLRNVASTASGIVASTSSAAIYTIP